MLLVNKGVIFCALGHLLEKMVRKEPWEALKENFYKKVFPKPQKIYKQQSNTYKAVIGYDKLFVIVLLYSLYIPPTTKGDLWRISFRGFRAS